MKARDALQALHMALHYATCSGVGRSVDDPMQPKGEKPGWIARREGQ